MLIIYDAGYLRSRDCLYMICPSIDQTACCYFTLSEPVGVKELSALCQSYRSLYLELINLRANALPTVSILLQQRGLLVDLSSYDP